jgi:hypothetical protein
MKPPTLNAAASARPLVLLAVFAYGLLTFRSAVWVTAAVLVFAEGFWWASGARMKNGQPYPPALVVAMAFGAIALGPLRSGAWLLCLSAEWLLRPALWDGGIMTHARRRRASRKAAKLRGHAKHAEGTADGILLAAAAAQVETNVQAATEPKSVSMTFHSHVRHVMSDGSERWEELPA